MKFKLSMKSLLVSVKPSLLGEQGEHMDVLDVDEKLQNNLNSDLPRS